MITKCAAPTDAAKTRSKKSERNLKITICLLIAITKAVNICGPNPILATNRILVGIDKLGLKALGELAYVSVNAPGAMVKVG